MHTYLRKVQKCEQTCKKVQNLNFCLIGQKPIAKKERLSDWSENLKVWLPVSSDWFIPKHSKWGPKSSWSICVRLSFTLSLASPLNFSEGKGEPDRRFKMGLFRLNFFRHFFGNYSEVVGASGCDVRKDSQFSTSAEIFVLVNVIWKRLNGKKKEGKSQETTACEKTQWAKKRV